MDYAKDLLKKEKASFEKYMIETELSEMLLNIQSINNVGDKLLEYIRNIEGEVALLKNTEGRLDLISWLGKEMDVMALLEDRTPLKKLFSMKKPLYATEEENFHIMLPIFSKEEFLGALCIFRKQEITCWEEIYLVLFKAATMFAFYNTVFENREFSVKDRITSLYNQHHFQEQLDIEMSMINRYDGSLSLLVFDIDQFRLINNKLGFHAGDDTLKEVGKFFKGSLRKSDMPARIDTDRFVVLLKGTDELGAKMVMERILLKAERHIFTYEKSNYKIKLKASVLPYKKNTYKAQEFLDTAIEKLDFVDLVTLSKELDIAFNRN